MSELKHYGVLGMKWGVRKERRAIERAARRDAKWATKGKGGKITEKAKRASSREAEAYARANAGTPRTSSGRISMTYINSYNKRLAELMNERVRDIPAPSGKMLRYVAKRGDVGVHTALADQGYNMEQVKNGIHKSGRVAYKKTSIDQIRHSDLMHHGVKGQKWGVRRSPEELDNSRKSGTMKLGDIHIGEKAKKYDISDPTERRKI